VLLKFDEDLDRGEKYDSIDVLEPLFSALTTRRFLFALDPEELRRSVSEALRLFLPLPDTSLCSECSPFIVLWKRELLTSNYDHLLSSLCIVSDNKNWPNFFSQRVIVIK
jgi:hypothetical protein